MALVSVDCDFHLYNLTKCGFYIGRQTSPKHMNTSKLLAALKVWAIDSNKPLIETSTYTLGESNSEAYCLGIEEHNGNYLIALWNKVHTLSSGGVGMVSGSSTPTNARITVKAIKKGDIPGHPSYFWILPARNMVVAVKITNPSFAITQFNSYLNGFLSFFSPHSVFSKSKDKSKGDMIGYSDSPSTSTALPEESIINKDLHPRLSMSVKKIPGKFKEFVDRHSDIRKLVKDIYSYNSLSNANDPLMEQIVGFFNNIDPVAKKKVRIDIPVNLSKSEVQGMIKKYEDNNQAAEHNVGFRYQGSNAIEWLHGANHTEKVTLKIDFSGEDQPDLKKLIKSLELHKDLIK